MRPKSQVALFWCFLTACAGFTQTAVHPAMYPNSVHYKNTGVKPATGRSGSANFTSRALLNKDGSADLEMTTGTLDSTAIAPGTIAKVQLKTYDSAGEAVYSHNYVNLTSGGYLDWKLTDLTRRQQLYVTGSINGIDPSRTDIATVIDTVALRPDLKAASLNMPDQAILNMPVNIATTVNEINTDVGATGRLRAVCRWPAGGPDQRDVG